ncbi:hypothetical protein WN944_005725 [Citrus x changshan-huyou]|uniref:Uncharacterized protein n=1 Tax=Citrus x changshan-huyou TaxID=2935761 RepID=A0AAP0MN02_9ROSI
MASSECRLLSALEATVTQLRTRLVFEKTLCMLEIDVVRWVLWSLIISSLSNALAVRYLFNRKIWNYEEATLLNSFVNHNFPNKGISKLCLVNELDASLLLAMEIFELETITIGRTNRSLSLHFLQSKVENLVYNVQMPLWIGSSSLDIWNAAVNVETWVSASGNNGLQHDWLICIAKIGQTLTRATRTLMMDKNWMWLSNRLSKEFRDVEEAKRNPPKDLRHKQAEWESLCDYFSSEAFKTETLGESPGLIALFRKMFWSEAKGWSSMEAKAKYDQMIDMKENSNTEENVEPLTDNQICEIVLGKKSNFVKKMIGPSKLTSNVALSQQNQEMAKTIEEQAKKIKEQDNRLQVVEDFIKFMKEQPSFSLTPSVDPALFDSQSQ